MAGLMHICFPSSNKEASALYRRFFKRFLDVVFSALALLLLALPMGLCALAVYAEDPGPVLFTQRRAGRDGRRFTLLKLRTMRMDAPRDMPAHLLADPQRYVLRAGRFLRRTGADELPQLLNILRGDMSLVGPRPALYNQDDLLAAREAVGANAVRPGLTGWAQINGRETLDTADKAAFDGEYVRRMSFAFDCRCIWGTAMYLVRIMKEKK